jgi:hypothetical protein
VTSAGSFQLVINTQVINLADYQIRRRPILDGLTSEYQISA